MGVKSSSIQEERLTENLDFYSEKNPKKETILFLSDKTKPNLKHHLKKIDDTLNNSNPTSTEEKNKSTKSNSTFNPNNEKVKFKFEWKPDPKYLNKTLEVLLVGDFLDNWNNFEVMKKNEENGTYEYEIYLSKKEHLFKFIINNIWECSDLYPKKPDKDNNVNNYIDLTNYKEQLAEKTYEEDSLNLSKELNKLNQSSKSSNKNGENQKKEYDKKFPELDILNKKTHKLSPFYQKAFDINNLSNQEKINKYRICFINNDKYNLYGTVNNAYKKLFTFHHEKIDHLISELSRINKIEKKYTRISTTERQKHKFLTIIYYKPNS